MIVDSHVHIASWPTLKQCQRDVLTSMKKYHIDFSLISNCNAAEYPGKKGEVKYLVSQVEALKQAIPFVRRHKEKMGLLVWIRPHHETISKEFLDLIEKNRDIIYGLKFHPFCSKLRITSPKMDPYFQLMEHYDLPMLVHTAKDKYSDVFYLGLVSDHHPNLKFIAAHMQLMGDNNQALAVLKNHPNLYGDTAWVKMSFVKQCIEELGPNRIMFGTDNPIDGKDTLSNPIYQDYFENNESLKKSDLEKLLYKNAKKLFKLPL